MTTSFRIDRVKRLEKLSKSDQKSLVFDLLQALVQTKSLSDAALFLQELLTKSETKMLGKRLRIAKLLIAGNTYEEIQAELHTSHTTVAKIAAWLADRGDGFRRILERLPKLTEVKSWHEYSEWDKMKRKYSLYFWPELLLEEIMKQANNSQKEKLRDVLIKLDEKSDLHKRVEALLR